MRIIITESQLKLISESELVRWYRRRRLMDTMKSFVTAAIDEYPDACKDYDLDDYVDTVIEYAIDEFLATYKGDSFEDDYYSYVKDDLLENCRNWFGPYVETVYKINCGGQK